MPGWFTGRLYKEPERFTPAEARERRLTAALEKHQKALEARTAPLSPANKVHLQRLKEFQSKFASEFEARRREVERLKKAEPSMENSRRLSAAISGYFQLKKKQTQLLERVSQTRRATSFQAIAADRRFFQFDDSFNPRNIFGNIAKTSLDAVSRRQFSSPLLTVPCIQRAIRKEVMFAKGHGGKGHKGTRRYNPMSAIGC